MPRLHLALAALCGVALAFPIGANANGGWHGGGGHGGFHGGGFHSGVFLGFGGFGFGGYWPWYPFGYYPSYYPYPYAYGDPYGYAPPVTYSPPPAVAPAPASHPAASESYWYFCPRTKSFYPYVTTCSVAWQHVPTSPPSGEAQYAARH